MLSIYAGLYFMRISGVHSPSTMIKVIKDLHSMARVQVVKITLESMP
jgi:hypothetical protein